MHEDIKQKKAYWRFQLEWMIAHGYNIEDLISELDGIREDFEDGASISELFEEWEKNRGFGGEIWPCYAEFLNVEYQEMKNREKAAVEKGDVVSKTQLERIKSALLLDDYTDVLEALNEIQAPDEKDAAVLEVWNAFADVPMDPETEEMEIPFLHFPAHTARETIWRWFDANYSKGVHALLYGDD